MATLLFFNVPAYGHVNPTLPVVAEEGLYFGVPLIVVPQQIEQVFNARQVARTGAGIALADTPPYGRVDAHRLKQAVDEVLANASYRSKAAQLSHSFREAGGYRQAASVIVGLRG